MKEFLFRIVNSGVRSDHDEDTIEQIRLLNGISLLGIPICLAYFIIFGLNGMYELAVLLGVGIPIFLFPIVGNRFFGLGFTRFFSSTITPLFFLTVTIALGRECGFYLGFLVITVPPLLFFQSLRKAFPYVGFSILCLVASIVGLAFIDPVEEIPFAMMIYLANLITVLVTQLVVVSFFRVELGEKRAALREKNKEITDSINYASRIQQAVLPPPELKHDLFLEAFVMLLPKDVVSGDFYWFGEKNGKRLVAAVDCTGHGVPGAFMSMIGNSFLHEIVMEQGVTQPAEILNQLRDKVIKALKQKGAAQEQKDGMDMALLCLDGQHAEFAGAKNPLYIVSSGELIETKGDKMPIGYETDDARPFTNHHIQLQPGDELYIFTDGFPDQFGGPRGKKYKYSTFKKLLASQHGKPMLEQEEALRTEFAHWKDDLEQIDDVCVIGVRV